MNRRRARQTGAPTAAVIACAGVAGALSGCASDAPPAWRDGDGFRWRELAVRGGSAGFSAVDPTRAGIEVHSAISERALLENDILANGSGVALGDYDADGLADIYLTSIEGGNRLYRNLGDWRFADATIDAGVGLEGSASRGAAWADVDGDGDLDLLVTRHSEPNVLFRNDGAGGFEDVSVEAGLSAALASHSLALGDTDGDGDLDLYVTNYRDRWARDAFSPEERASERVVGRAADSLFVRPGFETWYRMIRTEGGWQRWQFAEPDEYYVNDGGRFTRVSFTDPRFRDAAGRPLPSEPDEWGLAARFADLDLDGDLDLYVCNDINSPDHIWMNDGAGGFRLIDPLAIRKTSHSSMAVDVADVDRDGWPDLFVAEMLGLTFERRRTRVPESPLRPGRPGDDATRPQVPRNTLQMNRGDGTFAETALAAGLAATGWTWGVVFLDVDLDGYEDLVLANGHVLDMLDGDAQAETRLARAGDDWRRLKLLFPRLELPNRAYRNRGDGTFEDVSEAWRVGVEADLSHGLAAADLDGDGDLDLVLSRLGAPPRLLRNETAASRVAVRLIGAAPNTSAVGARVRWETAGLPAQTKEIAAGGLYLSHSDHLVSFAGGETGRGRLEILWPGGHRTVLPDLPSGRLYEIREDGSRGVRSDRPDDEGERTASAPDDAGAAGAAGEGTRSAAGGARGGAALAPDGAASEPPSGARGTVPLFEDVSEALGHTHHETIFDEFARQPLVMLRLAQLGPGVSWIDDDRDGDPDLWVSAGVGGHITRFENDIGIFTSSDVGPPMDGDGTALLPAPPGPRATVLVGQMNYEAPDPETGISLPSVLGLGGGPPTPVVGGAPATTGPLALADTDGDGDLDLFVGGRVVPTVYPAATDSRLMRNDGGAFAADPANAEALRELGLVSGALFSDLDGDGDQDLVLALEWGPPTILENRDGRFADVTRARGLAELTGRWNAVASGDLDEDGRPDLVLTGRGTNTDAALDRAGMAAVFGDFDRNGIFDVVELATDATGRETPALRLDQLTLGLPYVRQAVRDHAGYVAADLDRLLGEGVAGAGRVEASELRHVVLFNRGDRFEVEPLPTAAQLAPAFGVVVADLDGDGHDDVFLTQNFFGTRLEQPRYDAGRGLALLGDGTGALEPLEAGASGIAAYGDGRGAAAADYDGDGRIDLAVGQNASATRLFRNTGARPGLRVRLVGTDANPSAVGAALWVEYTAGRGPLREIRAGTGYWSHDDPTQVLGLATTPVAVVVRWPDGRESRTPVASGSRELVIASAEASSR